jgi:phosphoribosyl-ATP pyrophosphohydrolase/phosphoribosyl-AMP cyclohydrolase
MDGLDFANNDGLQTMVVQYAATGDVLMNGFDNRVAHERPRESRQVHFWARSRVERRRTGETSGNTLALVALHADCDGDSVLARAHPAGPTCHTGERSCFGEGTSAPGAVLARLDATLRQRDAERPAGSYTVTLLEDENFRLKKLGEETAELVVALATHNHGRAVEEAGDVVYHLLVALRAEGVTAAELLAALKQRAG